MHELAVYGSIAGLVVAILTIVTWLINRGKAQADIEAKATAAQAAAAGAQKRADEAHEKIGLTQLALGALREEIAKSYVNHETTRQLEDRLQRSTDKIETTQVEGFRQVHARLDALIATVGRLHADHA